MFKIDILLISSQLIFSFLEYHKRRNEINEFNKKNRWIKRGIAVSPMQYAQEYFGSLGVQVTIHHGDGSVAISHAGIECGQGINTKAAQIAAFTLGISMDLIKIKPSNNFVGSNAFPTGGSMTSEVVGFVSYTHFKNLYRNYL